MINFFKGFLIGFIAGSIPMMAGAMIPERKEESITVTVTGGDSFKPLLTPTPTPIPTVTLTPTPTPTAIIPKAYPQNNNFPHEPLDCERMSKDAQKKYGGDLIIIFGKDERGQYILGDYAGHMLNYIYVKELGKKQYIDYQTGRVYDDVKDHQFDFEFSKGYSDSEAFNLAERRPPFPIIWHY